MIDKIGCQIGDGRYVFIYYLPTYLPVLGEVVSCVCVCVCACAQNGDIRQAATPHQSIWSEKRVGGRWIILSLLVVYRLRIDRPDTKTCIEWFNDNPAEFQKKFSKKARRSGKEAIRSEMVLSARKDMPRR